MSLEGGKKLNYDKILASLDSLPKREYYEVTIDKKKYKVYPTSSDTYDVFTETGVLYSVTECSDDSFLASMQSMVDLPEYIITQDKANAIKAVKESLRTDNLQKDTDIV